jgi:two-component system, sporulation sensor kinase E
VAFPLYDLVVTWPWANCFRMSASNPELLRISPAAADGERHDETFRIFAEHIANLAWIADRDGWIRWYNRSWFEYTGTILAEMEGSGWTAVHEPQELPRVMATWKSSISGDEAFDMVFSLRARDGSYRPFLTRVVPYKDESGKVLHWLGTNTDISAEVEFSKALRQSEARFRTATEAVDAILWTNNAVGEMVGEQPGWSAFTGQSLAEYQGYGWSNVVHPDDAQPTIDAWEICVRERCLFAFEHRVLRHDGVYRLCSVRALPIIDESDVVVEWVGVHTDVTEDRDVRRRLQETVTALREQQELVDAAELVSQVGFWRYKPQGADLYLSSGSRHLLGLPQNGEASVTESMDRLMPEDVAMVRRALDDAFVTGNYDVEFRVKSQDPAVEPRYVRGVANLVKRESGEGYMVGMNVDITRQKLTAEALMRSEKLAVAGRLAASIAHEINNPLEAMTNLVYLLQSTALDPLQQEYVALLDGELARISRVAIHSLRFHRQSTFPGETPVGELVDAALAVHAGSLRTVGVNVERRLRATRPVYGFDGDLRQGISNLLENAIDAMRTSEGVHRLVIGSLDATSPVTGDIGIRLTIADTGGGIAKSMLGKIFDPFFTTRSATKTGLGLWVASEIVGKHGGTMRVRSRIGAMHHGSVFQIFLPSERLSGD